MMNPLRNSFGSFMRLDLKVKNNTSLINNGIETKITKKIVTIFEFSKRFLFSYKLSRKDFASFLSISSWIFKKDTDSNFCSERIRCKTETVMF